MRRIRNTALFAITSLIVLCSANPASAGEPFHPIVGPIDLFYQFFFGWF